MKRLLLLSLALLPMAPLPAAAHLNPAEHGSFAAGFSHPFFGPDHIFAMVAVGLWAALLGGRALWAVPASFVGAMLIGFAAALGGIPLPFVEPAILASVVAVGLLALTAVRAPVPVAALIVGAFALFHGHAHGGELGEAGAGSFALGFALATALLHGAGVAFGLGFARFLGSEFGRGAIRAAGGLTALAGLWLAVGG
ncbi:HupE/UreJ family protein [Neomegalonema perideroedes]|uniref:HupE/UreJ family protein n=1 Tax=Neomegalonema perideroedes TaxID=217219 RepID=UPI000370CC22|nr:HupE/UreJ family protein [Neomegalonema perideroedes]